MIGSIVNAASIIAGSIIGVLFNRLIPDRVKKTVMQAIGLGVVYIGASMALVSDKALYIIFSLVIGALIGEALHLEKRLEQLGEAIKDRVKSKDNRFVEGFVSSSLIFCIGAMAIVGSIQDGISSDRSVLYTKSLLDGTASIAFASALGSGVAFSAIPVLVYQGAITLLAAYAKSYLDQQAISLITSVGGVLIIGIAINIMEIKKVNLSNLLPAILVAALLGIVLP